MVSIEVVRGSLLEQNVEAIVNAANSSLRGGGGIDGAVHRAAGRELMAELLRIAPHGARTGQVVVTPGFETGFRYILHTPGPIWRGGLNKEPELLAQCYRNSTQEAERLGVRTLGFCSISTGVYGYPIERAAPIAIQTVRNFAHDIDRIVFAMFGEREFEAFSRQLTTVK